MQKATHNGTCQICGRQQAFNESRGIAKHGYSVEWGYFSGTCAGSDHAPLEIDRGLLDHHIDAWKEQAFAWEQVRAAHVESAIVSVIQKGRQQNVRGVDFAAFAELHAAGRLSYVYRSNSLTRSWAIAQERTEAAMHQEARGLRKHIDAMLELAGRTVGQPLQLRADPTIDLERHVSYHRTTSEAYRAAREFPKADGWKTRVVRRGGTVTMNATRPRRAGVAA